MGGSASSVLAITGKEGSAETVVRGSRRACRMAAVWLGAEAVSRLPLPFTVLCSKELARWGSLRRWRTKASAAPAQS